MAKTERLYIRIDEDLKKKLQERAKNEHRTLSNYVESILIKEIEDVTDPFNPRPIETDINYKY